MTGNCHVRCGAGENSEITSKNYLSLFGKVPNFNETLAVVRSYNIRLCIVLQGLSQLKALYEKTWESILGNCSIFTFLGTNDMDSKEYVSKKLGKTTVRIATRSYDRGKGGGQDNESFVQRELLGADEIPQAIKPKGKTKKYGGSCIVFVDEHKPMFIPKYDTFSHPLFEVTGSSFPKGIPNNTDIVKVYGEVYSKHKANHKQNITDFFEMDKQKQKEDAERLAKEQAEKDRQEQEELAKSVVGDKHEYKDIKDIPDDEETVQEEIEKQSEDEIRPVLNLMKTNDTNDEEDYDEDVIDEDDFEAQSGIEEEPMFEFAEEDE